MAVTERKKKQPETNHSKWFLPAAILIICISIFSLYHTLLSNDFLDLDDSTLIVKDYSFLQHFNNIPKAFTQGVFQLPNQKDTLASYYRPVMTLSFMVDAHLSNTSGTYPNPLPFLKANIFYHGLACILLLLLLLQLQVARLPSLLLTLIFAVHPLLNQAVAWIPGRNDSLLAIFILLSLLSLIKYRASKKGRTFALHILFFLLALFTKENAVLFIPAIFILLRSVFKEPFTNPLYKKLVLAYLLCIIPWLLIRQHALALNNSHSSAKSMLHSFISNSPYFIQYAGKAILPFNLSVFSTAADTNYLIGLAAILLVGAFLFFSKQKKMALVMFGLLWFLLFLIPSFFSGFSGLEHRAYLPLIGIILILSQVDMVKNAGILPVNSKAGLVLLLITVVEFYSVSASRLPIFHDRFSFDKSAVETSPKAVLPCMYLAQHYEQIGDYQHAIEAYREALKRDSTVENAHSNIAGEYIHLNDYPDAEKELRKELYFHPNNNVAVFNLGLVVFQGDSNERDGVALWKKSLAIDSGFIKPYKVLYQYYQLMGDSQNTKLYRNLYLKKQNQL